MTWPLVTAGPRNVPNATRVLFCGDVRDPTFSALCNYDRAKYLRRKMLIWVGTCSIDVLPNWSYIRLRKMISSPWDSYFKMKKTFCNHTMGFLYNFRILLNWDVMCTCSALFTWKEPTHKMSHAWMPGSLHQGARHGWSDWNKSLKKKER